MKITAEDTIKLKIDSVREQRKNYDKYSLMWWQHTSEIRLLEDVLKEVLE